MTEQWAERINNTDPDVRVEQVTKVGEALTQVLHIAQEEYSVGDRLKDRLEGSDIQADLATAGTLVEQSGRIGTAVSLDSKQIDLLARASDIISIAQEVIEQANPQEFTDHNLDKDRMQRNLTEGARSATDINRSVNGMQVG